MQDPQRFLDGSVFVNCLKADPKRALRDENALLSAYILHRVESGQPALTSLPVKDEVAIWLSRYRPGSLSSWTSS